MASAEPIPRDLLRYSVEIAETTAARVVMVYAHVLVPGRLGGRGISGEPA